MSVLKGKVNSSSNIALIFIVMTHISSVNFKVIPFLLWTKGSHQSSNFDSFKSSGENLTNSHVFFQTTSHFSFKFCIALQWSQLKQKHFLDFSSARALFCEVHVNFKTTSQFLFCTFLAQTIYTLLKTSPLK